MNGGLCSNRRVHIIAVATRLRVAKAPCNIRQRAVPDYGPNVCHQLARRVRKHPGPLKRRYSRTRAKE